MKSLNQGVDTLTRLIDLNYFSNLFTFLCYYPLARTGALYVVREHNQLCFELSFPMAVTIHSPFPPDAEVFIQVLHFVRSCFDVDKMLVRIICPRYLGTLHSELMKVGGRFFRRVTDTCSALIVCAARQRLTAVAGLAYSRIPSHTLSYPRLGLGLVCHPDTDFPNRLTAPRSLQDTCRAIRLLSNVTSHLGSQGHVRQS